MKKVLAFGTFDIFHKGHEFYLKEARKYGKLQVVVALDSTVEEVKGKLPVNGELTRLKVVNNLDYVDKAYLGNKENKYAIIEELKPDVIVLGYDQDSFTKDLKEELNKRGLNIAIVRIRESFKPEIYKSSKIISLNNKTTQS